MVDVATELRLADPTELFLMIRGDQAANIADLVNSSSELFFKSGALKYALSAGCELRWESAPTVRLDLEFRHATVTVFFRLTIGRARAGGRSARCLLRRRRRFGRRQREGAALRRHLRRAAALSRRACRPREGEAMNDRFDGVKLADAGVRELDDRNGRGLSREAALSLARSGQVAYRVIDPSGARLPPAAGFAGASCAAMRGVARGCVRPRFSTPPTPSCATR